MGAGHKDLRSLRRILHFHHVQLNTLRGLEYFALHLLILGQHCVSPAQIDADILANIALYDTCHNILFLLKILVKHNLALFLSDLLQDQVLRILCCDAPEFLGVDRHLGDVSDMEGGIDLFRVLQADLKRRIHHFLHDLFLRVDRVVAGLSVHDHLNVLRRAEMVLARTEQRILYGVHHDVFADVLLFLKDCQCFH